MWFLLAIPLLSFPTGFPVTAEGMNCKCLYLDPANSRRIGGLRWLCRDCNQLVLYFRTQELQGSSRAQRGNVKAHAVSPILFQHMDLARLIFWNVLRCFHNNS